jgi:uncharacterized cupredoxin-like copper-binding protein
VRRLSLAVLAALTLAAAAVAGPTFAARDTTQATTVKVTMKEFKFTFVPKTAKKGVVTFRLRNAGRLPHDFKIAGKKSKMIGAGKTGTLKVTLKAGRLAYLCTVPGHAAAGMKGRLTVK